METPPHKLPRGIYYEPARRRWRVRLYKEGEVVYRAYHHDLEAALADWAHAKSQQKRYVRQHHTPIVNTLGNLLQALAFTFSPHFVLMPEST